MEVTAAVRDLALLDHESGQRCRRIWVVGARASDELDLAVEKAAPLRQRPLFLLQAGELSPEVVELTHGLWYPKTVTVETSPLARLSVDQVPASVLAMDASPVLDRVATLAAKDTPLVLVGIGGHGCAGKTTLARLIPDAQIVSTDGFWNGTEFELSRLRAEVLEPIMSGEPAEYRAFSWATQEREPESRTVRPGGVVVIEGVCALHTRLRDVYDLRIWVEAPRETRLARAVARDGEDARATWEEKWLPSEERYVLRDDPISVADLIVDGS